MFLDEIGDMPTAMQAKLLRVLEEGEVERIGSDKPITVDVRVVVATHRNLEMLVESGGFRRDLYHRVVVFPVELPPLRKRCEDLPALVEHFARQVSAQNGWKPVPFTAAAIEALKQICVAGKYPRAAQCRRAAAVAGGERGRRGCGAHRASRRGIMRGSAAISDDKSPDANSPLAQRVLAFERATVLAELERNDRNITQTAKALGIERSHLYKKCQQLGIDLQTLSRRE